MNPDDTKQPAAQPPAPAEPAAAQPPTPVVSGGKKSKKGLVIGLIVAAVVVVGGVIAYFAFALMGNTPENLMTTAMGNLVSQKSYAGTLKATTGTGSTATNLNGTFAFEVDPANSKNWQGSVSAGQGTLKALQLNGTLYLRADNLESLVSSISTSAPGDTSLSELSPFLKNLNGQWFSLTQDEVKNIAQSTGTVTTNVSGVPTADDFNRLLQIYQQHAFVVGDKTYNDQVVGGSNSAHFSIKIDVNKYVAFMQAVKAANISSFQVTDDDINGAKSTPATMTNGSVEVWIARDTKRFTQIRVTDTAKGEESDTTLTLNNQLPTFDKFVAPAGAKPFSELMTTLLGPSLSSQLTPEELNAINSGLLSQ